METFLKVIRCWSSLYSRFYRKKNKFLALYQSRISNGHIEFGMSVVWNVPVRADGLGNVILGDRVMLGYRPAPRLGDGEILLQARDANSRIAIGRGTLMSNNISMVAMSSIEVGESCQIGDLVTIMDADFHETNPDRRNSSTGNIMPTKIGNNVWLGSRVLVLKGVHIGNNSVIAAGSVVAKSIPHDVLAAGVPAKIVRSLV